MSRVCWMRLNRVILVRRIGFYRWFIGSFVGWRGQRMKVTESADHYDVAAERRSCMRLIFGLSGGVILGGRIGDISLYSGGGEM